MTTPDENTAGLAEARRALAETRRSFSRTNSIVQDARQSMEQVHIIRERNHFADKFKRIIRGGSAA
jgi:hypothetical protein